MQMARQGCRGGVDISVALLVVDEGRSWVMVSAGQRRRRSQGLDETLLGGPASRGGRSNLMPRRSSCPVNGSSSGVSASRSQWQWRGKGAAMVARLGLRAATSTEMTARWLQLWWAMLWLRDGRFDKEGNKAPWYRSEQRRNSEAGWTSWLPCQGGKVMFPAMSVGMQWQGGGMASRTVTTTAVVSR